MRTRINMSLTRTDLLVPASAGHHDTPVASRLKATVRQTGAIGRTGLGRGAERNTLKLYHRQWATLQPGKLAQAPQLSEGSLGPDGF